MGCLQVKERNWCSHYVQLLKLDLKIPHRVWYKPLPLQILKCVPCEKQNWKDLMMTGLQLKQISLIHTLRMLTKWKQCGHYFKVQCLMCMLRNVVFDVYFHISVFTLKPFSYWNIWALLFFLSAFLPNLKVWHRLKLTDDLRLNIAAYLVSLIWSLQFLLLVLPVREVSLIWN